MVGPEVLLALRHVCLTLELELLAILRPPQDGVEVTTPPPRKWKLLGNEAGESLEQMFS